MPLTLPISVVLVVSLDLEPLDLPGLEIVEDRVELPDGLVGGFIFNRGPKVEEVFSSVPVFTSHKVNLNPLPVFGVLQLFMPGAADLEKRKQEYKQTTFSS